MKTQFQTFAFCFALQFLAYLNFTIDFRAVSSLNYVAAAATNMVAPVLAWIMVRKIASTQDHWIGMTAVALGGCTATVLGMWLTKSWS